MLECLWRSVVVEFTNSLYFLSVFSTLIRHVRDNWILFHEVRKQNEKLTSAAQICVEISLMSIHPIWFLLDIKLALLGLFSVWNKCPPLLISTAHVLVYTCEWEALQTCSLMMHCFSHLDPKPITSANIWNANTHTHTPEGPRPHQGAPASLLQHLRHGVEFFFFFFFALINHLVLSLRRKIAEAKKG